MKLFLALTLSVLLLTACAQSISQTRPLPAVDVPAPGAGGAPLFTPTTVEKVVEMATQTPAEEATLASTLAAPTAEPNLPTPTSTAVALPKTLEELGIPAATYQDKIGGLALDYPASWNITDLPDENKTSALAYSTTLRSQSPDRGPKQQEGIPPDMAAVDLTVIKQGSKTLEQAIAERRAAATTNEMGQAIQIALEEEWVLRDGLVAHRFLYNLGKDPLGGYGDRDKMTSELVTIINGNMVVLSGAGDLSLFNVVAASLREYKPGQ